MVPSAARLQYEEQAETTVEPIPASGTPPEGKREAAGQRSKGPSATTFMQSLSDRDRSRPLHILVSVLALRVLGGGGYTVADRYSIPAALFSQTSLRHARTRQAEASFTPSAAAMYHSCCEKYEVRSTYVRNYLIQDKVRKFIVESARAAAAGTGGNVMSRINIVEPMGGLESTTPKHRGSYCA